MEEVKSPSEPAKSSQTAPFSISLEAYSVLSSKRVLIVTGAAIFAILVQNPIYLLPWGVRNGISQVWRTVDLWWREPYPIYFSPGTDCAEWLRQFRPRGEVLVYNYGVNESLSGAKAMADCLLQGNSAIATNALASIQHILIVLPLFQMAMMSGTINSIPVVLPQSLLDIALNSPKLESVRWPSRYEVNEDMAFTDWALDHWGLKSLPFKPSISHHGNWEGIPLQYFIECSYPDVEGWPSYGGSYDDQAVEYIFEILTTCNNVKSLGLHISQGGCLVGSGHFSFPWPQRQVSFPNLDTLKLSGYNWSEYDISRWTSAMDWSKVRHLDIDSPPHLFLKAFHGELASLESLRIRPRWGFWGDEFTLCDSGPETVALRQEYTKFIVASAPLRSLSISGTGQLLNITEILERHGVTLESLSLHEFESDCGRHRPVLELEDIKQIRNQAPKLQSLALDIYRNGTWPKDHFDVIRDFKGLTNLTLYFALNDDVDETPHEGSMYHRRKPRGLRRPMLNLTTANDISRWFASNRSSDRNISEVGNNLKRLTLIAGDYKRQEGGGMRVDDEYPGNYPIKFECVITTEGGECT